MALLKCKMCGGDLELIEGASTAKCEFCGTVQTVPKVDDEKKLTLFTRANRLRAACDFDKAAGVYENIVADFAEESEAYWGLVLCKYGIEYVDDPATGKKVPTCHRSGFDSVTEDDNYEMALEYADVAARRIYREEAKAIERIRKGIIEVSSKEEPYDIFICYKETELDSSERTLDSVLAQDLYDALTEKKYRVFFSRVTLEDKLGVEYEPYIFAALNSAKILLAVGTDYEHFNAVWVKNEWSRYLKLMAQDRSKHLIPCYKNIDIEDLPKEFRKLQAQDLGKVGATQDLLRGIEKILPKKQAQQPAPAVVSQEVIRQIVREQTVMQAPTVDLSAPLQRGWDLLETKKWEEADKQFDRVLELDGRSGMAYAGKLCARFQYRKLDELKDTNDRHYGTRVYNGKTTSAYIDRSIKTVFGSNEYRKALEYADANLQAKLKSYHESRLEYIRLQEYSKAKDMMTRRLYQEAIKAFSAMRGYRDSEQLIEQCKQLMNAPKAGEQHRAKLAAIRKRNAPAQRCCVSSRLVGVDGLVHGFWEDKWKNRDGLVSAFSVEFQNNKKQRYWYEYGLKANGEFLSFLTFSATAEEENWEPLHTSYGLSDIVSAVRCACGMVVLDKNGVAKGLHQNANDPLNQLRWENIVQISAESRQSYTTTNILGLRADGTVVAYKEQYKYNHWKDIAALSTGSCAYAITNDGSAVTIAGAEGYAELFRCTDLVAMSGSVGLRADGTVVADWNIAQKCKDWKNVVAIFRDEENHELYGICSDGKVYCTSEKKATDGVRLFKNINTLSRERVEALEKQCEYYRDQIQANKGIFHKKARQQNERLLAEREEMIEFLKSVNE